MPGATRAERPFIFSRWSNEAINATPIGFSGDSFMTWGDAAPQAYMTPTASNVAYGWWSHDIGGHISGAGDPSYSLRWVRFKR
ncbi:MAG: hypothetical protein IPK17_00455 [Chloroflexi bacterium]|nr:hypothetical protein [Chloroflexota bacterium]